MTERRLFAAEIGARLDDLLFASHSHRAAAGIAESLEALTRRQQELLLHWVAVAAQTHVELGALIASLGPQAFELLDGAEFAAWALAGLEAFDRAEASAAMTLLRDLEGFRARQLANSLVANFADVEARLSRFLQGLAGRPMPLRAMAGADSRAWTDTDFIYLPDKVGSQAQLAANQTLYRVLACMLWGQARFGTFGSAQCDLAEALAPWPGMDEQARACEWLAALESVRLEAKIASELPGLGREIAGLRGPWPKPLTRFLSRLQRHEASLADSLALLAECMASGEAAPGLPHAVRIDPAVALGVRSQRILQQKEILARAIHALKGSSGRPGQQDESAAQLATEGGAAEAGMPEELTALPPEAQAAAQSLLQDLGEIPPECLLPAGPGRWQATSHNGDAASLANQPEPDHLYDEWDYRRQAYRRDWCHLFESDVPAGPLDYVEEVRTRHADLIRQIRRRFEMLRGETRMLGRQADGEEVDLDAIVDALGDRRAGREASARLFCRRIQNQRSLAAMFMVDMSGSTKGWVNDAEREALVMLCEALEALGDDYAIYGFSGWTHTRCDIYRIKEFAEGCDAAVRSRIAAIEAKDYTRMGVAIRHLTRKLLGQPARHRLLVTLSDGRPDDFGDDYRGHYGIEDTRRALQEAHQQGVRSYCITIDRQGADYLAHMYGAARYTVLDDVRKLPLKVADIYRRLTS